MAEGGEAKAAAPVTVAGGRYEIIKPIGKGKFAVVYRAKRVEDGELVALKKIAVDSMDDKAREKCLKEVRLLQSVHHPNIVRRSGGAAPLRRRIPEARRPGTSTPSSKATN